MDILRQTMNRCEDAYGEEGCWKLLALPIDVYAVFHATSMPSFFKFLFYEPNEPIVSITSYTRVQDVLNRLASLHWTPQGYHLKGKYDHMIIFFCLKRI